MEDRDIAYEISEHLDDPNTEIDLQVLVFASAMYLYEVTGSN